MSKRLPVQHPSIDRLHFRYQAVTPALDASKIPYPALAELTKTLYGSGDVKSAVIDYRDLGLFVPRILVDERTLNRYIFIWAEEISQNELFAIVERITGKPINGPRASVEEINKLTKEEGFIGIYYLFALSIWINGDNTIEKAKQPEWGAALDAKELYPDIVGKLRSFKDFAKEHYQ